MRRHTCLFINEVKVFENALLLHLYPTLPFLQEG